MRRIKQEGPRLEDITQTYEIERKDPGENKSKTVRLDTVPIEVLGDQQYAAEPSWGSLPMMQYMEFYQGLRERNWTSKHYNKKVRPGL